MQFDWQRGGRDLVVAVQGCAHGALDDIYASLQRTEQKCGVRADVLLCCGDFQALRNEADMACLACPPKYRAMNSFHRYYSGQSVAPVLTIFVGGNHEASNYLNELRYGGWVAPNIYYLGSAGVVNVGGVRIAGLSGIYKSHDYHSGHHERAPFDRSSLRSVYHIRDHEVCMLAMLAATARRTAQAQAHAAGQESAQARGSGGSGESNAGARSGDVGAGTAPCVDVFLSHDWPAGIAHYGDTHALLRKKRFLEAEVRDGSLGSPPGAALLGALRPRFWFSAHLHVKFAALVRHGAPPVAAPAVAPHAVPAALLAGDSQLQESPVPVASAPCAAAAVPASSGRGTRRVRGAGGGGGGSSSNTAGIIAGSDGGTSSTTRFLALDKCLPGRDFLQLLRIRRPASEFADCDATTTADGAGEQQPGVSASAAPQFEYDPEWLAIVRATHTSLSTDRVPRVPSAASTPPPGPQEAQDAAVAMALAVARLPAAATRPPAASPLAVPRNFCVTAPPYGQASEMIQPPLIGNPQTDFFLAALKLPHIATVPFHGHTVALPQRSAALQPQPQPAETVASMPVPPPQPPPQPAVTKAVQSQETDPNSISLDDLEEVEAGAADPNSIELDDLEDTSTDVEGAVGSHDASESAICDPNAIDLDD